MNASSFMSSSFECQSPNTQRPGRPMQLSLQHHIPRSMMPVWGESCRTVDAPGRTADFLTPGGYSEEGILELGYGQPMYRRARSHPGMPSSRSNSAQRPSSSFAALRPSLSSSNISHLAPPVSAAFRGQPMSSPSAYVPDSGSEFSDSSNFAIAVTLDPTAVTYDSNLVASPDGIQAPWEHHHQSLILTSPEAYPIDMQAVNYANGHPSGDVSPSGLFQLNFGDNREWQTHTNASPSYFLTTYCASSPSTSSQANLDTHFYEQDLRQGPKGV